MQWLELLEDRLDSQAEQVQTYEAYYAGHHPLQFATYKFRQAFGNLFQAFADNWCEIVIDAPVERLTVVGFRTGDATATDDAAWAIWQENALDVASVIAHTEAGKCGRCYLMVDPTGDDGPQITVESAAQVIVACDPADRRNRLAALKKWTGDDGALYANVYLPDGVYKWTAEAQQSSSTEIVLPSGVNSGAGDNEWEPLGGDVPYSLGRVPVVPLENKPSLMKGGQSDLNPAIPVQNAINKLCTDMLVASEYGAFPQRVVTGIEVPRDPETGQLWPDVQLQAAMSRHWFFENPDARTHEFSSADLGNYVKAIDVLIQHLAAQTRTPPHYLLGQVVNVSGDALAAAEAGLVAKCKAKQLFFSDAWEEAMALALSASGGEVKAADCEALWANPERSTPTEEAAAAVQRQTLGVPEEQLWLELGYTPAQIEEWKKAKEAEPPPPPPPSIVGPNGQPLTPQDGGPDGPGVVRDPGQPGAA